MVMLTVVYGHVNSHVNAVEAEYDKNGEDVSFFSPVFAMFSQPSPSSSRVYIA